MRIRRRPTLAASVAVLALLVIPAVARAAEPSPPITYETRFTNPVSSTVQDSTIEQYVLARIDEAQPGTKIGFAVRDWTVQAVADAQQRAADRGVEVTGVTTETSAPSRSCRTS